jgi:hypothetical protein
MVVLGVQVVVYGGMEDGGGGVEGGRRRWCREWLWCGVSWQNVAVHIVVHSR